MRISHIVLAASMFASAGVSAHPLNAAKPAVAPVHRTEQPRHAVLDNIIGRVQMDVLINTIVTPEEADMARRVRNADYAVIEPAKLRTRS